MKKDKFFTRVSMVSAIAAMAIITGVLAGCLKEDETNDKDHLFNQTASNEKSRSMNDQDGLLNLIAPSGERISESIATLKEELYFMLGINEDFELTGINYIPITSGYAATIEYQTLSGVKSNFIKANVSMQFVGNSIEVITATPRLKSRDVETPYGHYSARCEPRGNCPSCEASVTMNLKTGELTARCSCDECTLIVTYAPL